MVGAIRSKPHEPFRQAIIIRRDLHINGRQAMAYATRATLAFVAARARAGEAVAFNPEEAAWLRGKQAQLHLRAHGEAQLNAIAEQARRAGLEVHLIVKQQNAPRSPAVIFVCCAVGPASWDQIAAITGHLTVW